MTRNCYFKPETERVRLNTHEEVLITIDPEHSTDEQLGNQGEFDEESTEEYDEFFNEF